MFKVTVRDDANGNLYYYFAKGTAAIAFAHACKTWRKVLDVRVNLVPFSAKHVHMTAQALAVRGA